jgi:hypothetical protein
MPERATLPAIFADWDRRMQAALDWLVASWEACGRTGSAAYCSPLFGWSGPYPETTGYIIPTLWQAAERFSNSKYSIAAEGMARWLLTLQSKEGWFPGGIWSAKRTPEPSIFNTGQILFGLMESANLTQDSSFSDAAERAAMWLVEQQDADGRWRRHAYRDGYSPSYYAHVCWPLAQYWAGCGREAVYDAVIRGLTAIAADRQANGTYSGWGFASHGRAFTHTMAYTLQGIIESALLLNEWDQFAKPAADTAEKLLRKFELKRQLAGAYDSNWNGTYWFACLTGHCQLASTWLRIYEHADDPRFLNAAVKAIEFVKERQLWSPGKSSRHGAIAGSTPLFGPYLRFRYPNWAAKFFVDAAADAKDALQRLSDNPGSFSAMRAAS